MDKLINDLEQLKMESESGRYSTEDSMAAAYMLLLQYINNERVNQLFTEIYKLN